MLQYQGLSFAPDPNKPILKALNLHIRPGEFFVLIGPSGSGKSTALKLVNRLLTHTQGELRFQGRLIQDYPLRELRLQMGYVLQQIALFPHLTVAENIALLPKLQKRNSDWIQHRSNELLNAVGLPPEAYAQRFPKTLSGGEQQRVGIVRAFMCQPKLLLMDEPFSSLDPLSRSQLQSLTKQLHHSQQMSTLFITHDMQEAFTLADRIGFLYQGKLLQVGTPEQFRQQPTSPIIQ